MPGAMEDATKDFNAQLVTKNNAENEDQGVHKVLMNLKDVAMGDNMNNLKKDKDIKKEQLMAGLAFLRGHKLDDVKKELTKTKVEDLRHQVVTRYEHMKPNKCDKCQEIYRYSIEEHINYRCILCAKGMCPTCCTTENIGNNDMTQTLLFFICSPCVKVCSEKSSENLVIEIQQEKPKEREKDSKQNKTDDESENDSDDESEFNVNERKKKKDEKKAAQRAKKEAEAKEREKEKTTCSFFKKNKCRFGKEGKGCRFFHPKHCYKFAAKGKEGCSKGSKCDYFHPKLCYDSVNKKECIREECSFLHLPGTQRTNQNVVCTYCEEAFKTKFELEKHNSLKHKDRRQSYASVVANNEKQFPFQETNMTQQPPGIFQFMEKQAQMMAQMMEVIKGLQPKQNQNQFLPQMSGQFPVQQHH